jgi:hypothetical protein
LLPPGDEEHPVNHFFCIQLLLYTYLIQSSNHLAKTQAALENKKLKEHFYTPQRWEFEKSRSFANQNAAPPPIVSLNSFFERIVEPLFNICYVLMIYCVRFIRSVPRALSRCRTEIALVGVYRLPSLLYCESVPRSRPRSSLFSQPASTHAGFCSFAPILRNHIVSLNSDRNPIG